jgi:hypothetical protein
VSVGRGDVVVFGIEIVVVVAVVLEQMKGKGISSQYVHRQTEGHLQLVAGSVAASVCIQSAFPPSSPCA